MAQSVSKNPQGPFWPLGLIKVPSPGTPVGIMSLVDPSSVNAPESATSATSNEYTPRANQVVFQGMKPGASHGLVPNTGYVYILMKGVGAGSGNYDDQGVLIGVIPPGGSFSLASAPLNRNTISPYEIYLDADVASEGATVLLIIQ